MGCETLTLVSPMSRYKRFGQQPEVAIDWFNAHRG
jgi:hypothetical protein